MWNPFRSKLAAAILGGVDNIWIVRLALISCYRVRFSDFATINQLPREMIFRRRDPGFCTWERLRGRRCLTCPISSARLGSLIFTDSGAVVLKFNHYFGGSYPQSGVVYAVEFSHRSGRDLVNMAKKRTNIIPIIEDARHPARYRMLVGMVDVIFSDVAQPDQVCFLVLLFYLRSRFCWFNRMSLLLLLFVSMCS